MLPHSYQAVDAKRADECTTGVEWLSVKQRVKRLCQAIIADFISGAGHSLSLYQTYIGSELDF